MKNKDKELLDYISMLPFSKEIKFNDVFRRLIVENWHIQNENMASAFQHTFNYDVANIPTLLRAIKLTPKYLDYGEMKYPYIRKIIYAIGAQPEPYNINALIKLSEDVEDSEIKELVLHQIKKRKKLGSWEAKQNT